MFGLAVGFVLVVTSTVAQALPGFQLSGTVRYQGDASRPVPATAMVLRDAVGHETVTYTDSAGHYAFDSFGRLDGWQTPWVLTPRRRLRYEETDNTLSALDAARALQTAVGIQAAPAGIALLACDVTGDGSVSSLDATRILQNRVGLGVPLGGCDSEWAFAPIAASGTSATLVGFSTATCSEGRAELATAGGSLPNATVDFDATAFGDCSGNWRPSTKPAPWMQALVPPPGSHYSFGAITRATAIDPLNNVVAAGETVGEVDVAGILASDPYGVFIVKFTDAGDPLWSVLWPRPSGGSVRAIAADPSGNIVITGVQSGETFYGDDRFISPGGTKQVYVAKLRGEDGSVLWAKAFGSAGQEQPGGIAVTGNGTIVVGLGYSGTLNVGGGDHVSQGPSDGLVMALSPSGQLLWDYPVTGAGNNKVTTLSASGSRIVVGGWFAETLEAGSKILESMGSYDAFVLELDASGVLVNSIGLGGSGFEYVEGVARSSNGELAVVGSTSGTDFPEPKADATPDNDAFIVVISNTGSILWGRRLGSAYLESAHCLAFDPADDLVVGGRFGFTVDFGGVSLTSFGQYDGFVAKYEGDSGALEWAERIGGSGVWNSDWVQTVAASEQGIYAGGQFNTEYTWTGLNEGFDGNRAAFVRRFDP